MRLGHFPGQFKRRYCLFTSHGGEIVQELVEGITALEIIVEILDRYSRANEHRSAT